MIDNPFNQLPITKDDMEVEGIRVEVKLINHLDRCGKRFPQYDHKISVN